MSTSHTTLHPSPGSQTDHANALAIIAVRRTWQIEVRA